MEKLQKISLKPGKESSLQRFHPWIFSGAIKSIEGTVKEGDLVEVYTKEGNFIAIGHYQIGSIAVRIITFDKVEINKEFWKKKIISAISLRQAVGLFTSSHTNVFRLINGEGDGFPGFIADYYNGTIVFQAHSIGMYFHEDLFAEILKEIFGNKLIAIYDKSEQTLPYKAKINPKDRFIIGQTSINEAIEYNMKFIIDVVEGQKTGFFIDQRENRKLLEAMSNGKDVLNVFCYTGGFSVAALRGGANLVHSIDSSAKAIDLTNKNVALNFENFDRHKSFDVDAFNYLETIDNKYDLIILDPPAFAKHNDVLDNALKGYKKINKKAIEKIKPGGILFTFSCSQVVTKDHFRTTIFTAAMLAKRNVKILYQLTQPADHPVSIFHPEGEYLKGLVLWIE